MILRGGDTPRGSLYVYIHTKWALLAVFPAESRVIARLGARCAK